jgi:hypothetical protein
MCRSLFPPLARLLIEKLIENPAKCFAQRNAGPRRLSLKKIELALGQTELDLFQG